MASTNHHTVTSADHFKDLLSTDLDRVSLLNFWAPWAEPCKQMNEVVKELAVKYPKLLVLDIEAESQDEITDSFEIESVPSFIVLRGHTLLGRISGADASALTTLISKNLDNKPLSTTDRAPAKAQNGISEKQETSQELEARMRGIMSQSPFVLFMKGSPDHPQCGFSRRGVALLREHGVTFTHFDILSDERVRAGMKVLNNWPTFPQFICQGEFIGGLDVVNEMVENGEFAEVIAPIKEIKA